MIKMDISDSGTPSENGSLSSLEELYTDFDQWLMKFRKFCSKRSYREAPNEVDINEEKLCFHDFLIHGVFVQKTPVRHSNYNKFSNFDNFVSNDYVILDILMKKSKYMRSKL